MRGTAGAQHATGPPRVLNPPSTRFISACAPYPIADGGVDENMYKTYWADLAFELNDWGAFCSKVSPNVNVLAVIQVRAGGSEPCALCLQCTTPRQAARCLATSNVSHGSDPVWAPTREPLAACPQLARSTAQA